MSEQNNTVTDSESRRSYVVTETTTTSSADEANAITTTPAVRNDAPSADPEPSIALADSPMTPSDAATRSATTHVKGILISPSRVATADTAAATAGYVASSTDDEVCDVGAESLSTIQSSSSLSEPLDPARVAKICRAFKSLADHVGVTDEQLEMIVVDCIRKNPTANFQRIFQTIISEGHLFRIGQKNKKSKEESCCCC